MVLSSVVEPQWLFAVTIPVPTLESFCSGSGSGSYSGSGSRQYLAQFSKNEKIAQNLAFSVSEAAYFPESWPPISDFFVLFFITFYVGSGTGTVMHSGSGSAKAKSYGFCRSCSGSTTLVLSRPGSGLEFPVWCRSRSGSRSALKTMPTHADPVPSYTFRKIRFLFTFVHTNGILYCFYFRISGKGIIILSILDSVLGFYRKE